MYYPNKVQLALKTIGDGTYFCKNFIEMQFQNNNTNSSFHNIHKTLKFKLKIGKLIKYVWFNFQLSTITVDRINVILILKKTLNMAIGGETPPYYLFIILFNIYYKYLH